MTLTKAVDHFSTLKNAFISYDKAVADRTVKDTIVLKVNGNEFSFDKTAKTRSCSLSRLFSCRSSKDPHFDAALKMKACFLEARKTPLVDINEKANEKVGELKAFETKFKAYVEGQFKPKIQAQLLPQTDWDLEAVKQTRIHKCVVTVSAKMKKDTNATGNFKAALKEYVEQEMRVLKARYEATTKEGLDALDNRRMQILGWVSETANLSQLSELKAKAAKVNVAQLMVFKAVDFRSFLPGQLVDQRCILADLLLLEKSIKDAFDDSDIQLMKHNLCKSLLTKLEKHVKAIKKSISEEACVKMRKDLQDLQLQLEHIENQLKGVAQATSQEKEILKKVSTTCFEAFQLKCEELKIDARSGKDEKVEMKQAQVPSAPLAAAAA